MRCRYELGAQPAKRGSPRIAIRVLFRYQPVHPRSLVANRARADLSAILCWDDHATSKAVDEGYLFPQLNFPLLDGSRHLGCALKRVLTSASDP